jgi:hypothetical protein
MSLNKTKNKNLNDDTNSTFDEECVFDEESLSEIGLRRRNLMNQSSRILSNQLSVISTSTTSVNRNKSSSDPPDSM